MIARYAMDRYDKQLHDAVCAWLTANSIDPTNVPRRAEFAIADGQLTYDEWRRDGRGRVTGPYRRTTPLLVPMPAELDQRADWRIAPRLCDRCQTDLEETP